MQNKIKNPYSWKISVIIITVSSFTMSAGLRIGDLVGTLMVVVSAFNYGLQLHVLKKAFDWEKKNSNHDHGK